MANKLYGKLNTQTIITEYTGKTTSTAQTIVNPKTHEIEVNVLASSDTLPEGVVLYNQNQSIPEVYKNTARKNIGAQENLPTDKKAGTYTKVTINNKGIVQSGEPITLDDLPDLKDAFVNKVSSYPQTIDSCLVLNYNKAPGQNSDLLIVNGNIKVDGAITQRGKNYIVDAELIQSTNNYIRLRYLNPLPLNDGEYTGIEAKNYNGINDGRLVFDNKGIARVGDVGDEQPLATREENPTDGRFMRYKASEYRLISDWIYPSDVNTTDYTLEDITDDRQLTTKEYVDRQVNKSGLYRVVADEEEFEQEKIGAPEGLRIFIKSEAIE